jgi:hypothetical protein
MLTSLLDERPWWVFPIECDDVVIIKAQALVDVPNKQPDHSLSGDSRNAHISPRRSSFLQSSTG